MQQALLLDLGNVILGIDFNQVADYWARAAGVDIDHFLNDWHIDQAYMDHETGHLSFEEFARELQVRYQVELPLQEWERGWNAIWTGPFDEVVELLPHLAERYQLCCFSNTNHSHAAFFRSHYGSALRHFQQIYASPEIGMRKPDPQAFAEVCRRMDSAPHQIVFVDDSADNIAGARRAGLQTRHVPERRDVVAALNSLLD